MKASNLIAAASAALLSGCGGGGLGDVPPIAGDTPTKLVIYTVNYPLAYFAERIGGDLVAVHFPAPEDVDPAF